ncbi:MAG: hypothetical protein LPK09_11165 [Hymenobacteraceae bacterium]|nr:hypothetical protein [Hymenobacteraceae bacterium]
MRSLILTGCTFLILFSYTLVQAQPTVLSAAQWREDVKAVAAQLPKMHRAPYHKISEHAFDSAVAELHAKVPHLRDHEIMVGLTRLVAMVGDGHTRLTLPQDLAVAYSRAHTVTPPPADSGLFLNHLPIKMAIFDDGLFIKETTPDLLHLIGAQVTHIGTTSAEMTLQMVRPVVHYDNEMGFKLMAPAFLVVPEFLTALGITAAVDEVFLKLKTRTGAVEEITLAPMSLFKKAYFLDAYQGLGIAPPLSQWNRKDKYWMHVLEEEKTLYIQVNEINSKDEESIADFVGKVERIAEGFPVHKLVLDLRYNAGGNGYLNRSLVLALARSERINQFGRLYTLIGRETFSAAQMLANDLEYYTNTLFVGEPTGSTPSAYGDSRKMQLPNSKLTIRASTVYWRDWNVNEKRPWTAPDIPVVYTSADYLAGKDPVLEAALRSSPEAGMAGVMQEVHQRAGFNPATWIYFRLVQDARTEPDSLLALEQAFGEYLLQHKRAEESAVWYSYIGSRHKEKAWPLIGLAQAQLLSHDAQKAAATLEKAIQLEPANKQAKELLVTVKKQRLKS